MIDSPNSLINAKVSVILHENSISYYKVGNINSQSDIADKHVNLDRD